MKSQYDVERKKFSDIEDSVEVPKYQRRLVWSSKQKEDFIDNVSKGYPFGSILLYRYENSKKLSLIDGLQRYSAMTDFKKNPSKYFKDWIIKKIFFREIVICQSVYNSQYGVYNLRSIFKKAFREAYQKERADAERQGIIIN